jgi:hypothetical protein
MLIQTNFVFRRSRANGNREISVTLPWAPAFTGATIGTGCRSDRLNGTAQDYALVLLKSARPAPAAYWYANSAVRRPREGARDRADRSGADHLARVARCRSD